MLKNITISQKRIVIISVMAVLVFLVSWLFIYLPAKNKIRQLKTELLDIEQQIQKIETLIAQDKTIEEGMRLLNERFAQINSKFPQKEEESLRMLSDLARKFNITVVSVKSSPKTSFLDRNQQSVSLEGKNCHKFVVTIDLKSSFNNLIEYFGALKESLPSYFIVEQLKISRDSAESPLLNVALTLNLYLLS